MSDRRVAVNNISLTVYSVERHNSPEINLFVDVTNNSMNFHGGVSMDLTTFMDTGREINRIINPTVRGRRLNRRD